MGIDYFEQAKNYAPEIKNMMEPNLFFDDNPTSQVSTSNNFSHRRNAQIS
jgi:hypothetical protein